ncbi:putative leader peptide [Streptomyces sp. NPDC005907]|uniref:putative leader peptide n=1 Tax=Streptomyces sp. NPDC005907 TaxID=3154571 RepID=UPI003405E642
MKKRRELTRRPHVDLARVSGSACGSRVGDRRSVPRHADGSRPASRGGSRPRVSGCCRLACYA